MNPLDEFYSSLKCKDCLKCNTIGTYSKCILKIYDIYPEDPACISIELKPLKLKEYQQLKDRIL